MAPAPPAPADGHCDDARRISLRRASCVVPADGAVLDVWRHHAAGPDAAIVLPDGCRDVIIVRAPGGTTFAFVTGRVHAGALPLRRPPH